MCICNYSVAPFFIYFLNMNKNFIHKIFVFSVEVKGKILNSYEYSCISINILLSFYLLIISNKILFVKSNSRDYIGLNFA